MWTRLLVRDKRTRHASLARTSVLPHRPERGRETEHRDRDVARDFEDGVAHQ